MSIKKRLFISNILMVASPMVLTFLMLITVYWTFSSLTGINIFLQHDRGIPIFNFDTTNILPYPLEGDVTDFGVYVREDTGQQLIVLPADFSFGPPIPQDAPRLFGLIVLLLLLSSVFIINVLLIKFVFGNIKKSLLVLRHGVNEISEGNLTYKIQHHKGNEFDAICTDFNFMANKLYHLVTQTQREENNRKELIAGISHDLRTPLATIKAYVEGLRSGIATTDEMKKKYLDTIYDNAENIEYILNQLFLFSKIDIGEFPFKLEQLDIGDELTKLVRSLSEEYHQRGLDIHLTQSPPAAIVSIDVMQFRNVIQNLLNNTVKYGNQRQGEVNIHAFVEHNQVVIHLTDNGPGVPDDTLTKLFDVFYRTDDSRTNQGNGSGLGLAICAKIMARLGGHIHAENAPQGGLKIIMTLPLIKEHSHEKNTNY